MYGWVTPDENETSDIKLMDYTKKNDMIFMEKITRQHIAVLGLIITSLISFKEIKVSASLI